MPFTQQDKSPRTNTSVLLPVCSYLCLRALKSKCFKLLKLDSRPFKDYISAEWLILLEYTIETENMSSKNSLKATRTYTRFVIQWFAITLFHFNGSNENCSNISFYKNNTSRLSASSFCTLKGNSVLVSRSIHSFVLNISIRWKSELLAKASQCFCQLAT